MDDTLFEAALTGKLQEEGTEQVWLSEIGLAETMDKKYKSSYNMNERPSLSHDGFYTPDVFSSPTDIIASFLSGIKEALAAPLETGFPTIDNDQTGGRSWPKGTHEQTSRIIKPTKRDLHKKQLRVVGVGINNWGAPMD